MDIKDFVFTPDEFKKNLAKFEAKTREWSMHKN